MFVESMLAGRDGPARRTIDAARELEWIMGAVRSRLRRWHVWLGWLVGLPMLFWTVSGLVMVARPISEVRGESLIRDLEPLAGPAGLKMPALEGRDVRALSLEPRAAGARWILTAADGSTSQFDPRTGLPLPGLSAADAAREVAARYTGDASIVSTSRVSGANAPIEYRRSTPSWLVRMSDGTHFYVDAGTGAILARRTRWWRVYDFMWGLHIMDLEGREDSNNPWVVSFAALGLAMVLLALCLLPMTLRRRRNGDPGGVRSS